MRIIAGKYKGCRLKGPGGREFRPTSDRVKEAVFSILQFAIEGRHVLDLYAGSGSLGLEALSRNAAGCTFVESNKKHAAILKENLAKVLQGEPAEVLIAPADQAITFLKGKSCCFDIVFIDPPYGMEQSYDTLFLLGQAEGVINGSSVVVVEHAAKVRLSDEYGLLQKTRECCYGDTRISFFQLGRGSC
ncbi:MAG: 16S rRNA (guanine(966)-N(2))-methyltransferase RsmD [Bacillota bacterium]